MRKRYEAMSREELLEELRRINIALVLLERRLNEMAPRQHGPRMPRTSGADSQRSSTGIPNGRTAEDIEEDLHKRVNAMEAMLTSWGQQKRSTHDYQRQTWGNGWIQKDRKKVKTKKGEKEYAYWYYHWIEDGKRKSKYIGNDEQLAEWKERNPAVGGADSRHGQAVQN